MDGQGRKISKSLGNFTDPFKHIAEHGSEIWRLWVASEDYQQDVRISPEILRQLGDTYRKIRNTVRFLLGNLHDFRWPQDALSWQELTGLDQYALMQANEVQRHVQGCFGAYSFHSGVQRLVQWCNVDLSAFYLDVIKDRLYASKADSAARRSAQTAMYVILHDMVRLMAPVFCFTSEEIFGMMPKAEGAPQSVHLTLYPERGDDAPLTALRAGADRDKEALLGQFGRFFEVRPLVTAALENARRLKEIGASVQAHVTFVGGGPALKVLDTFDDAQWADLLIVSQVSRKVTDPAAPLSIEVSVAQGDKCPRCWLYRQLVPRNPQQSDAVCTRCHEALS